MNQGFTRGDAGDRDILTGYTDSRNSRIIRYRRKRQSGKSVIGNVLRIANDRITHRQRRQIAIP